MTTPSDSNQHETKRETAVMFAVTGTEVLPAALTERGVSRVLVLSSAGRRGPAEALVAALGERSVGVFAEAEQHVPRALAERAMAEVERRSADAIVAIGGGSVVGLGKAIALLRHRAGLPRLPFAVLPTTYAGSEMTAIWGLEQAEGGGKEVGRDEVVRADLVIYDPALSAGLPPRIAIPSLFNAMAHAVDALFPLELERETATTIELAELAEAAIVALAGAIDRIAVEPSDPEARLAALAGCRRAGELLDRAGMSLHHKLAHVLGGRFAMPHAPTHTVLLPHVIAFMAAAAPRATARLARALAAADPAAALFDLQTRSSAPQQLAPLGFAVARVEEVIEPVLAAVADGKLVSPRTIEAEPLRELLVDAALGRRPSVSARRLAAPRLVHTSHAGLRPALAGAPLGEAKAAVLCVHGRGSTAEAMLAKLEALLGGLPEGLAAVAIQAADRSWYDHGFVQPVASNEPKLGSALELLAALRRELAEHVPASRTVLFGFSQGACLTLDHLARDGGDAAGVVAIAGALIGADPVAPWHDAEHRGTVVVVGVAEHDSWVPRARVEATADHLEARGAVVERVFMAGDAHTISDTQAEALRRIVTAALGDD